MLAGFHAMDEHFRTAPFDRNLPVLMGLLAVWYSDFLRRADSRSAAVRAVPEAFPRLPPAADHGEQRQTRDARGHAASTIRPDRSTGASRARMASTLSISSSTRGRSSSHVTSSVSSSRSIRSAITTTCCWPMCSRRPRRWRSAGRPTRSGLRAHRSGSCRTVRSRATDRRPRSWPSG